MKVYVEVRSLCYVFVAVGNSSCVGSTGRKRPFAVDQVLRFLPTLPKDDTIRLTGRPYKSARSVLQQVSLLPSSKSPGGLAGNDGSDTSALRELCGLCALHVSCAHDTKPDSVPSMLHVSALAVQQRDLCNFQQSRRTARGSVRGKEHSEHAD